MNFNKQLITRVISIGGLIMAVIACDNPTKVTGDMGQSILQQVPYEEIDISGELYLRTMRNFDRLEEERYRPDKVYLTEEESGGWPGDTEGRTILGLVLDAQATKCEPLYLQQILDRLPDMLNEKGYMGIIYEGKVNEQQLSGNGWMLRGLCEYYEWKKDEKVLDYIKSIANLFVMNQGEYRNYPIDTQLRDTKVGAESGSIQKSEGKWMLSSDIGCVFIGMEGLIHAYKILKDPALKEVIDELVQRFLEIDLIGIRAQTHATLTACRGLIRLVGITGDDAYIQEVEKRWKLYKSDGMTETFANYNWFDRYDTWTEPCAIVDSYMVAVQLWQHTGNFEYRNDAELIYYNALAHAQRSNGGFGCDNCPGEAAGTSFLKIHAYEAYWCCTMRGGEGMGSAVRYSVFTDGEAKVYFPFYHEGQFDIALPKSKSISISEFTHYPFRNCIEFMVKTNTAGMTSLLFPIPYWMENVRISLNGDQKYDIMKNEFYELKADFKAGDRIVINYELPLRFEKTLNNKNTKSTNIKAFCGPLLLTIGESTEFSFLDTSGKNFKSVGCCRFKSADGKIILSPIYHLLSPRLDSKSYQCKINY